MPSPSHSLLITFSDLLTLIISFLVVQRSLSSAQASVLDSSYLTFFSRQELESTPLISPDASLTLDTIQEIAILTCSQGAQPWLESLYFSRLFLDPLGPFLASKKTSINIQLLGPNCASIRDSKHPNSLARMEVKKYGSDRGEALKEGRSAE